MSGIFPKYKLTDKQIRGIACIVAHEQGSIDGWYAEASQIANRTDIRGNSYATPENAVKTVTSGWYAKGRARYNAGTNNATVIAIVKRVFCDGYRTLPRYVDEHDCMSDIATVKNGSRNVKSDKSKWVQHKTIIHNKMSSTYYFYSFPGGYKTGVDPFGYTSIANRRKWGDFCYTVEQAQNKIEFTPARLLADLSEYNTYIKSHYKYFYNHYDSEMTTFSKAKAKVAKKKKVGLTCVVPLRFALAEMGLKNSSGKSLISGQDGTFKSYYTGDFTNHLTRITKGESVGLTVKQAIDKKLLKPGDIICYHKHTHTSIYSGKGYKFYEGGSQCDNYSNGILVNYEHYPNKISEILRWKDQGIKEEPKTVKTDGNYTGKIPAFPNKRDYYQLNDGITVMVDYTTQIKYVQNALNWALKGISGFKVLTVDGKYGRLTEDAVKLYQKVYKLSVDGKWGKQCNAKLKTIKK